jgi:acetyl/propionyl-CoA carboxylase alpha subunit
MADNNKLYQVKANEFIFFLSQAQADTTELIKISPDTFHLIHNHRSITAKLIEDNGKKLRIELEGESFEIDIKDELDQVLDKMGFSLASNKQIKEIKAPMPGLVLEVTVTDGQEVNEGDKILILEAMKMENSILIHTGAKIKRVAVTTGQAVEKGQVLVELE